MRALVVSNCVTATFAKSLQAIFPAWEVRGAGVLKVKKWIEDGSKPEFTAYAGGCDLYLGWDPSKHPIGTALNPAAEKVVVPEVRFRGLHPDLANLPGFWGPFSVSYVVEHASLIMLAAIALGYDTDTIKSLFRAEVYDALGYSTFYETERTRFLKVFSDAGMKLKAQFGDWESMHDFFFVPHHPRVFVLFDIVLRVLSDRYLNHERSRRHVRFGRSKSTILPGPRLGRCIPRSPNASVLREA